MSNTRIMLATLALGTAIAFAGPAFAEKLKATLNGASEVPPNNSAGKGTADIDYDAATKKLSWKLTYSGLSGQRHRGAFPRPGRTRQECRRRGRDSRRRLEPSRRQRHPD